MVPKINRKVKHRNENILVLDHRNPIQMTNIVGAPHEFQYDGRLTSSQI